MTGGPPARIDRAALDRIIQRAAELQGGAGDAADALTEEELLALGQEVGIAPGYLRQALLEEQARVAPPVPEGLLDRVAGVPYAVAQRVVRGTVAEVDAAIAEWLERHELLGPQRAAPGRSTWERLSALQAAMRRSQQVLRGGRLPPLLDRVDRLTATVTALEPGYCLVSLRAELRALRAGYVAGGISLATVGALGAAALVALDAALAAAVVPAAAGVAGGWFTVRRFPPLRERAQTGLERLLDHLEHREPRGAPPTLPPVPALIGQIASEIRRALREGT